VAIARQFLHPGTRIQLGAALGGGEVILSTPIPAGHKLALLPILPEEVVRRYGQMIGFASQAIRPGDHVHIHNLALPEDDRAGADALKDFGADVKPVDYIPENERRTFLGFRRPDGQVGTRNFIAVISTVNCSAHTCREIAHHFTAENLKEYPQVDGVIPLTHTYGCATRIGTQDYQLLARTLMGMARHPNVGAAVFVGLGCESNQPADLLRSAGMEPGSFPVLVIQDQGGIRKTVQAGISQIEELLAQVNAVRRTPRPVSELKVALQCGGSDAWSGVTANPVVGAFSDLLVRQGGTVVLAETPEIYGAEYLLTRRAASREVGQKLIDLIAWWEAHSRRHGIEIDFNRSAGNAAGGLSTIYEKSLGAVAKAGSTPLTGVYQYAEQVTARGFTYMDSPGYDPVAVTGQVAGGCNLVLFTTGRGSAFGFKPAPSIKISTNTPLFLHMDEDMDFDGGQILHGIEIEALGAALFELAIQVASGEQTKSEAQNVGEAEFAPWHLGSLL
jgi:altronate dehydratase